MCSRQKRMYSGFDGGRRSLMSNLELLWDYQIADTAADRLQTEMKHSVTRQKLLKCRENLEEQQKNYKRIESEIGVMSDRLEALKDALSRLDNQLKSLQTKVTENPAKTSEEARKYIGEIKKLKENLVAYEQEINKLRKDSQDRERQQHDVKMRYAKYKNDFAALKETYDREYSERSEELEKLRAVAKEKSKAVDPSLLERYQQIKRHSVPPLSRLSDDKCSGCNMNLPSGVVRAIRAGELIECETCGRLVTL